MTAAEFSTRELPAHELDVDGALGLIRAFFGGRVPRLWSHAATDPLVFESLWGAGQVYFRSSLPPALREAVLVRLSRRGASHYCLAVHGCLLSMTTDGRPFISIASPGDPQNAGDTSTAALHSWREREPSARWPNPETDPDACRAVVEAADTMLRTPGRPEALDGVIEPRQLAELMTLVSFARMTQTWTANFGDELDVREDPFVQDTIPHLAPTLENEQLLALIDRRGVEEVGAPFSPDNTDQALQTERTNTFNRMRVLRAMTNGVAHDFNNLLTVIITNLQFLDDVPEVDSELVVDTLDAAREGAALLNQLAAFCQPRPLNPTYAQASQLFTRCEVLLRKTLGRRFAVDLEDGPENLELLVDRHQFEAAIFSLCLNARDALGDGGTISIRVHQPSDHDDLSAFGLQNTGDAKDYAIVSITDPGPGIDREVRPQIAQPFFTTKGNGTTRSLGLTEANEFVQQAGGGLTVTSDLGEGTTVSMLIPARRAACTADAPSARAASTPGEAADSAVLVVEDEAAIRRVLCRYLEKNHIKTVEAGCADEALQLMEASRYQFDLVFADIVLPGERTGLDLARVLRERHPDTEILLTTGYKKNQGPREGREAADTVIIDKPYNLQDILTRFQAILGRTSGAA